MTNTTMVLLKQTLKAPRTKHPMQHSPFSPVRICCDWSSSSFISGFSGGGSRGKPPKPSLAVLSSGWAPNGGPGMIVPPGQVRTMLNRSLRATRLHGKQRENFSCWYFFSLSPRAVFLSLSLSQTGQPDYPPSPPSLSLSFFPLHSSPIGTKMLHSSNPLWIFKCRWVVQIVVSAASGADCENLPEFDSRGLFSFLIPPSHSHPHPLPSPALSLPRIFLCLVMALMSQTQVSLIINDPGVVGP